MHQRLLHPLRAFVTSAALLSGAALLTRCSFGTASSGSAGTGSNGGATGSSGTIVASGNVAPTGASVSGGAVTGSVAGAGNSSGTVGSQSGTTPPAAGSGAGSGAGSASGTTGSTTGSPAGSGLDASLSDADTVTDSNSTPPPDSNVYTNWQLTWSDEFNGAAGTQPDPKYWSYDIGGGGWGVMQLQVYTNSPANAQMDGLGNLAISAILQNNGTFTSARIKTQGKFEQAYGRFEMRAKTVTGNGMWPAFWMLGNNFNTAGWPQCGEIDIMEIRGTKPWGNGSSLHGPGYSGQHPLSGSTSLPDSGPKISDDYHLYALEWEVGVVRFYLDDVLYETHTPADIPLDAGGPSHWVYDHPFFILINVAVGGMFPGPPDGTVFPQTMLVDYVRVYERPDAGGGG